MNAFWPSSAIWTKLVERSVLLHVHVMSRDPSAYQKEKIGMCHFSTLSTHCWDEVVGADPYSRDSAVKRILAT